MKQLNTTLKSLLICLIILVGSNQLKAQLPMTRSIFTGAYSAIVGGTTSTATGDDSFQQNIPVGFSFNYLGSPYTQFSVSTNGWLSFANGATFDAASTNLFTTLSNGTVAPWWDDLSTSAIVYQTTGTPGTQVCTVQWTSLSYWTGSTRTINYQVKLYEGSDVIEFWYGAAPTGTMNLTESASIGMKSMTGGNGQYLDGVTGSAFVGTCFTQSDRWPANNIRFTPGSPAAISSGTYNVGIGQTYINLNEAVAEINHRGIVGGPVVLNLVDAQYDVTAANGGNTFPIFLGPITNASAINTLTISKIGTAAIIQYAGSTGGSGANQASATALTATAEPIIGLVGADYVTLNNLDIRGNVGGQVVDHGIGVYNSSANDGATNNTISNVSVVMNRAITSTRGFISNVVTVPASAAGANSNNTFKDFTIASCYAGIQLTGNAANPDLNTMIIRTNCATFNTIGNPATANDIGGGATQTYGIRLTNQSGFTVSNNSIRNVSGNGIQTDGILVETFQGTSTLNNNKVQTIRNNSTTSTTGISGIRMTHTATGTHTLRVFNNSVSEINSAYTGAASAARTLKGIFVSGAGGATTQTYEIYNNSVSIDGSSSLNVSSAAFEVNTTSGPVYKLGNNIFANHTAAQTGISRHFCITSTSATALGNTGTTSDNNDFFLPNDAGVTGFVGLGNATTFTSLANWQAAMVGLDLVSLSVNPSYVNNNSDLHSGAIALNSVGMAPPAYIVMDLDCATRTPDNDIGAYIMVACSGMPTAGTITGAGSVCIGSGTTLTLTGATAGAGISYQWASSLVSGGPYTTLLGTTTTQATGPVSVPTYFVVGVGCSVSGLASSTIEFAILVNPLPVVAVTPTSGNICNPGGSPVALTASGALTYTWLPIVGLTPSTGANVSANPAVTTTYTVSGTDGNGCVNTATAAITVGENPGLEQPTATPSSFCSGGNSQLLTSAGTTTTYTVTNIPFASVPTPGSGVTTLANTGVAVTPLSAGNLDDGGWMNQALPFNFMFFGINYNSFAVSTNGFVFLGTGAPNTYNGYNNTFPSTFAGRPSIGALYSDLDFRTLGTINYFTTGTAPYRAMVLNWSSGNFYNAVGSLNTQMIIYETTNVIEVHTTNSTGTNAAVESIQNAAGTTAFPVVGRNNVTWVVGTPDAYRWSPAGGPVTYSWSPATFLSSTTINNPMANTVTATTTYTVTASVGACSSTGTVTLPPFSVLTATSGATPSTTVCENSNVTLNTTPAGGEAPYTYSWTGPNTFTSTNQNPIISNITTAAAGVYTVVITDNCASTFTVNVTLTVNPLPVVALSGSNAFCPGDSTLLTGTGGGTSQWYINGVAISGATANTYYATSAGVYNMTKTNLNGCVDSAAVGITVTINALPVVTANASASTVCSGSAVTLTGGGATSYVWSGGQLDGVPFNATATTNYTVTGTDGNGCTNTSAVLVTVNALPVVTLGADIVQCAGSTILDAGNAGSTYLWNDNSTLQTLSTSVSGTFYVAVTDGNACVGNDTIVVTINSLPVVALGADIVQCGGSATLDAGNIGSTYLWSDASTSQTLSASVSNTYFVAVTDANGCVGNDTILVTINAVPVVALGNDSSLCGGSITLDAQNVGDSYLWSDNSLTQTLVASSTGIYWVDVTNSFGCTTRDSVTITVNTLPTVALGNDSTSCGSITIDAGNAGSVYLWNDNSTNQTLIAATSGTYFVDVTSPAGCSGSDTVLVTINTPPTVTFSIAQTSICVDDAALALTGSPAGGVFTGPNVTGSTFDPSAASAGTYGVTYTFTDGNGCSASQTDSITVSPCTGVTNTDLNLSSVMIYPNPNAGQFTIQLNAIPTSPVTVEITDALGQIVSSFTMAGTTQQVDLGQFASGVYSMRVTDGKNTGVYRIISNK